MRILTMLRTAFLPLALVTIPVAPAYADAVPISGPIDATLTIFDNAELVGNVTCTVTGAPCIRFGAPDITLKLNGFTMTGKADAAIGCAGADTLRENGISTNGQNDVVIEGPGLVQRFRFFGVFVVNSSGVKVRKVTASTNCISGIGLNNASDTDVEENVLVRNGNKDSACGGIELFGTSNNNRIRRNETSGNGYAGVPGVVPDNDFGIGILQASTNNLIEENTAVGNTKGILLGPATSGNVVRRNVMVGNPPIQISNSFPGNTITAVDIRNIAPAGANTFEDNLCVTFSGNFIDPPCSVLPDFAGHQNPSE